MNSYKQLLSDLAISTEKPIDPAIITLAMMVDLYMASGNHDFKRDVENWITENLLKHRPN